MKVGRRLVLKDYNRIKRIVNKYIGTEQYEDAAELINQAAYFMWNINEFVYDEDYENAISEIARKAVITKTKENEVCCRDKVIFLDLVGYDVRGLAMNYLEGLIANNFQIEYITYKKNQSRIKLFSDLLENNGNNSKVQYITNDSVIASAKNLRDLINQSEAADIFIYCFQYDIVPFLATVGLEKKSKLLINLGDHAFWLGTRCIDYCIEYRDYGHLVSNKYRKIDESKLLKLPFRPNAIENIPFAGLPFALEGKSLIVTGGGIYKTIDKNSTFYSIVREILNKVENSVFLMLSNDTCDDLLAIIREYPGRVFHLKERKDFIHIIARSTIYLSSYPLCGGMMFQYAVSCNKLPLALKNPGMPSGFLLDADRLNIEFDHKTDLVDEAVRLLQDSEYRTQKESVLGNQIITQKDFCEQLRNIVENKKTIFEFKECQFDEKEFHMIYYNQLTYGSYCKLFLGFQPYTIESHMLKFFPLKVICGLVYKASRKLIINKEKIRCSMAKK